MAIARTLNRFLNQHHIEYDLMSHTYSEGSINTAQCASIPANNLLKAVVFKDEDRFYTMAVLPSSHRVLRHTLNGIFGSPLKMVDEEELSIIFHDCKPGAIPSIGQAYGLRVIWEEEISENNDLWIEAGDHTHLIRIPRNAFLQIMDTSMHDKISKPRQH